VRRLSSSSHELADAVGELATAAAAADGRGADSESPYAAVRRTPAAACRRHAAALDALESMLRVMGGRRPRGSSEADESALLVGLST
jgi:hypothetical protein